MSDTTDAAAHADRERRFKALSRQGAIESIRRRCEQLRTETEDGLVLHAANDIEEQGELLYRHAVALDAARVAAEQRAEKATVLLRQAHDAMMDWHFAHGEAGFRMDDEERAMGAACRAIQDFTADAAPAPDRAEGGTR